MEETKANIPNNLPFDRKRIRSGDGETPAHHSSNLNPTKVKASSEFLLLHLIEGKKKGKRRKKCQKEKGKRWQQFKKTKNHESEIKGKDSFTIAFASSREELKNTSISSTTPSSSLSASGLGSMAISSSATSEGFSSSNFSAAKEGEGSEVFGGRGESPCLFSGWEGASGPDDGSGLGLGLNFPALGWNLPVLAGALLERPGPRRSSMSISMSMSFCCCSFSDVRDPLRRTSKVAADEEKPVYHFLKPFRLVSFFAGKTPSNRIRACL